MIWKKSQKVHGTARRAIDWLHVVVDVNDGVGRWLEVHVDDDAGRPGDIPHFVWPSFEDSVGRRRAGVRHLFLLSSCKYTIIRDIFDRFAVMWSGRGLCILLYVCA